MANTTITSNRDVDYIQKDFDSVVDASITFANVNFGPGTSANRLWTNFNSDSFSRNWLEIVAFVSDALYFYLDTQATQSYLQTATVDSAVRDIARQFGFTPASETSASGVAQFTVTGAGTIPRGFRVQASNGSNFYTTTDTVAVGAGVVNADVIQGELVSETFVATGLQNEEFELRGPNVVVDQSNLNPLDISPSLTVSGNNYTLVDTLIRQTGEDTAVIRDSLGNIVGGGGRAYLIDERPDGTPFIRFGDGVFGRKLAAGETVVVNYRSGGGSQGNIPEQTLTTALDTNVIVASVTNPAEFSGGADEQSIEQLRELIPASLRTLERAVAEQDYSDILTANFPEVFAASTEANNTDPGVDLNIYVVPQGLGIPQISDNLLLRDRLNTFLDRRKTVTVQFQILDAFSIDVTIGLEVFISDTASRSTVTQAINTALQDFFSLSTGGASGSGIGFAEPILISDICNIIDAIDGVVRFEIQRLTYEPRVEQNVVGLVSTYNVSPVTTFPNVEEVEWLLAASGPQNEVVGTTLFNNDSSTGFTYDSVTGLITYAFPVALQGIAPGDQFRDGASTDFTILAVDTLNSTVTIPDGQTVNITAGPGAGGSIRNGATAFQSFKAFKKILATATNLSGDTLTDNNLNLTFKSGTGVAINSRTLLDNSNVFLPGEFSTAGDFFLVDAASNVWEILSNDSNTIFTSITAVNDAAVTSVADGEYQIVRNVAGGQVIFNNSIFNIQYNNANTVFSVGAQFSQIGTIGDAFSISIEQNNVGRLGVDLDIITFDSATGVVRLNGNPNLNGISTEDVIIDNSGQLFNIVGVDNISRPSVIYSDSNLTSSYILQGDLDGSSIAQGFQVVDDDTYAVVSFFLQREGNILGNLTCRIVADDGSGLPDLSTVIATAQPIDVTTIGATGLSQVFFGFNTPPSLTSATQYHAVLSGDAGYATSEQSGVVAFDNTGLVPFTYNPATGVIQYSGAVNLSNVLAGNFFVDSSGARFSILAVSDADDTVTLADALTIDNSGPSSSDDGSVVANDRILVGFDNTPTYADGEFAEFDGLSQWSNSSQGPNAGSFTDADGNAFAAADLIFSVEGTRSITEDSNLEPSTGPGGTVSRRYYDDEAQISLVLGISNGSITQASDVNGLGIGTVASVPNSPVDNFEFRTSRFADDIVNLRLNEIPQLPTGNVTIDIFGGVE